ncbi:MAG: hypothetical protein DCC71_12515 [Proteobacteria bacterium]|nr:MAG: hypothetical protein DCC71_12515 [Pseudomonadota bacterium]
MTARAKSEARAWPQALAAAAALGALFLVSARPFLGIPPRNDSRATLWLIEHASPLAWAFDPRVAAYQFVLFFEPGFALLHFPGLWLAPALGDPAHHVAALAGAACLGLVCALLVRDATRSLAASCAAAALVLFSTPVWYGVADSIVCHYPWATACALASLRAPWRGFWTDGPPPGLARSVASALAFGAGLCFKESVAAAPALIVALHVAAFRRPLAAARFVAPHALVLAAFLAWRTHVLGGAGGYFMLPGWTPANWLTALPVLFYAVWGHAAVGLLPIAALALLRPLALALALVAWGIGIAPFGLAAPLAPDAFSAARLLFPFAFTGLLLVAAAARHPAYRRRAFRRAAAAAAAALLALQLAQRPLVIDTYLRQPADPLPPAPWSEPIVVVSDDWIGPTFRHQRQPAPKPPLVSYRTALDRALDEALGSAPPPGTRTYGVRERVPTPQLAPLPEEIATVSFDAWGRAHLALAERAVGRLWLAVDYANGATRFLAGHPLLREQVDLPLARSVRRLVLFEPRPDGAWPARVWDAPAHLDPWPPAPPR